MRRIPAPLFVKDGGGDPSTSLRAAVSCITSPCSVLAIFVLIVNDHVLKQMWPSWVTGKLSDFAGLYFAPYLFLLVAYSALWLTQPLDSRRQTVDRRLTDSIAICLFGGTFALFIAVKLSVFTAAPALDFLSLLAGERLAATVDPTDLVALVVIPAAYLSWRRRLARFRRGGLEAVDRKRTKSFLGRAASALIIVAAGLAVSATSPSACQPEVLDVAADTHYPNVLYAMAQRCGPAGALYRSIDGGNSWKQQGSGGERTVTGAGRKGAFYIIVGPDGIARCQYDPPQSRLIHPPGINFPIASRDHLPALHLPGWEPDLIYVGAKDAVARSEDGGATWSSLPLPGPQPDPIVALASTPYHGGVLFTATEKEVYVSQDGGDTWAKRGEFLETATALMVHPTNPELLIAGARNGLQRSLDGGRRWATVWVAANLKAGVTSLLFTGEQEGNFFAAVPGYGLLRSDDAGASWRESFRGDVRAVTATKSKNSRLFLAAGRQGMYRQRGAVRWPWLGEWEHVNQGLPAGSTGAIDRTLNLMSWLAVIVAGTAALRLLLPRVFGGILVQHGWHLLIGLCSLVSLATTIQEGLGSQWYMRGDTLLASSALSLVILVALVKARPSWAAWAAMAPLELSLALISIVAQLPAIALVSLPFVAAVLPIMIGRPRIARMALMLSLLFCAAPFWLLSLYLSGGW